MGMRIASKFQGTLSIFSQHLTASFPYSLQGKGSKPQTAVMRPTRGKLFEVLSVIRTTCFQGNRAAPGRKFYARMSGSTKELLKTARVVLGKKKPTQATDRVHCKGYKGVGLQPQNLADRLLVKQYHQH
eukprot:916434-Pelagomonas_calceolata.AAC.1